MPAAQQFVYFHASGAWVLAENSEKRTVRRRSSSPETEKKKKSRRAASESDDEDETSPRKKTSKKHESSEEDSAKKKKKKKAKDSSSEEESDSEDESPQHSPVFSPPKRLRRGDEAGPSNDFAGPSGVCSAAFSDLSCFFSGVMLSVSFCVNLVVPAYYP